MNLQEYVEFLMDRYPDLLMASEEHLVISGVSVLLGCLAAIPIGILLSGTRSHWLKSAVFGTANVFQTIPSLALLAILIPILGIGIRPAVFALFLYSLLPILRNTYAGFQSVDPSLVEAARGMGYSSLQRLWQIQLPLAFPYIMSGIRITTVYVISWTTLAALIGAGGLGTLIFSGIGVNKEELIFSGAAAAIVLALAADFILGKVEHGVSRRTRLAPPSK
jgi:osmoprotectant transport system permease protein